MTAGSNFPCTWPLSTTALHSLSLGMYKALAHGVEAQEKLTHWWNLTGRRLVSGF